MDNSMIALIGLFYGIVGLCFGSFSNVLIYRFSNSVPLTLKSRSVCPKCGNEIKWYDNIPLISFIILKGKCRHCHEKISIQYPLIELCGMLSFIFCFLWFNYHILGQNPYIFSFDYRSIIYSFTIILLVTMALIDSKTKEIPLSLQACFLLLSLSSYITYCSINLNYGLDYIIGACIPLVLFGLLYLIFYFVLHKEAMGLGDIILYFLVGLMLGYKQFILILLISSFSCSIIELIRIKITKKNEEIPFVPYIAAATIFAIFFGDPIINSILSLVGIR